MTMIAGKEVDLANLPDLAIATMMRHYRTYALACFLTGEAPQEAKRREANAVAAEISNRILEAAPIAGRA